MHNNIGLLPSSISPLPSVVYFSPMIELAALLSFRRCKRPSRACPGNKRRFGDSDAVFQWEGCCESANAAARWLRKGRAGR